MAVPLFYASAPTCKATQPYLPTTGDRPKRFIGGLCVCIRSMNTKPATRHCNVSRPIAIIADVDWVRLFGVGIKPQIQLQDSPMPS